MLKRITAYFDIRADESTLVLLLFLHSFFVGMPRTLGNTVAVTRFESDLLPFALVVSAGLSVVVSTILNQLQQRVSFLRLGYMNLTLQFGSLLLFYGLFTSFETNTTESLVIGIAFYVWMQVLFVLTYKEYWDLAGRMLNIRQSKRLYPLIGAGEVLFTTPVGLLGAYLTWIGVLNLLLLAALGVIGSVLSVAVITRRYGHLINQAPKRERTRKLHGTEESNRPTRKRIITRYVFLIMALAGVYTLGLALVKQLYLDGLALQFGNNENAESAFVLVLTGVTGGFNLILRLFFVDDFMRRFGVAGGLLVLPVVVLVASSGLSLMYMLGLASLIFAFVVLVRGAYMVLKSSIERPAGLILFQTFDKDTQQRLLTIRDGIVEPIAAGIAGIALLLMQRAGLGSAFESYILAILVAVWIIVVLFTLRSYAQRVTKVLKRRSISIFSELFQDGRNLARVQENLSSDKPTEVLYALHVLDSAESQALFDAVPQLITHPSPLVRQEAFYLIEKYEMVDALPAAMHAISADDDSDVQAAAVRTVATLGEDDVYDQLLGFLTTENDALRTSAMVGLLRSGDLQGVISAGNKLIALSTSEDPQERQLAAQILGEVGNRKFYRLLLDLLEDDDLAVRNEAILAAGKIKNENLWVYVVDALLDTPTRGSAILALSDATADVLPEFDRLFRDEAVSANVKISIANISGRLSTDEATAFLYRYWDIRDLNVRMAILEALAEREYSADAQQRTAVYAQVQAEAQFALWCAQAIVALQSHETDATTIVVDALQLEVVQVTERVYYWLSFVEDTTLIMNAQREMTRADKDAWALILEALDQVIDNDLKPYAMPLFERSSPAELQARLQNVFPERDTLTTQQALMEIIQESNLWIDPWLRTSAIYVVPDIGADDALAQVLYQQVKKHDGIVAETALWSLSKVAPSLFKFYLAERKRDSGGDLSTTTGLVEDTIGYIRKTNEGGESMLLTIEKVLILKQVSIFSSTSEEFLADIATMMEEALYDAGDVIVKEGTPPQYLYTVLEGSLTVTGENGTLTGADGDVLLATIGTFDFFGAMSFFLSDRQHTATVTAKTATRVLKLHHEDFKQVMYDYPQVTQGIIREFARRLRETNKRVIDSGNSK